MNSDFTGPETGSEPIPGYCLAECLGRGGYGEVWKAYAPGGFQVALKFVPLANACGATEQRALDIIRDIRHPNLLVTFSSWQVGPWLIIAMELADKTLAQRFQEAKEQGLPGIPRDELLDHFQEAARGIDFLNEPRKLPGGTQRIAIQHRDIKPQNILLVGNGIKVADFGLVRVMMQAETGHSGALTPAYAALEFFKGRTTSSSDQYSFALTYCMMRGGRLPFGAATYQQLLSDSPPDPDLSMIPAAERGVVGRALSKNPKDRWRSCRLFVEQLIGCDNVPSVDRHSTLLNPVDPPPVRKAKSPARALPNDPSAPTETREGRKARNTDDSSRAKAFDHGATAFFMGYGQVAEPNNVPPAPPGASRQAAGPGPLDPRALRAWVIGREPECDVVIDQNSVSNRHCRLSETADGYLLEDLGSSNGTFVNGQRIASPTKVSPEDRITLGRTATLPWPEAAKADRGETAERILTIGRDPENDVVLDYPNVSARHARIVFRSGQAHIEDLGSSNGIAIGAPNRMVSRSPLNDNDVVYFGTLAIPAARLLGMPPREPSRGAIPETVTFRGTPILFGRDADCDVSIDLATISGRHAMLRKEGKILVIEDLGSKNGTFVNGRRIHQKTQTAAEDLIGLGSHSFRLRVEVVAV